MRTFLLLKWFPLSYAPQTLVSVYSNRSWYSQQNSVLITEHINSVVRVRVRLDRIYILREFIESFGSEKQRHIK